MLTIRHATVAKYLPKQLDNETIKKNRMKRRIEEERLITEKQEASDKLEKSKMLSIESQAHIENERRDTALKFQEERRISADEAQALRACGDISVAGAKAYRNTGEAECQAFAKMCNNGKNSIIPVINKITNERRWGEFPTIRSINNYDSCSNMKGLAPMYYKRVCRILGEFSGGARGGFLETSKSW